MKIELGLSALIDISKTDQNYFSIWVRLIKINENRYIGVFEDEHFSKELLNQVFEFEYDKILTLRGTLDWNIENLIVECNQKVFEGAEVGYFRNACYEIPNHCGRLFYAVDQVFEPKNEINLIEIPLTEMVQKEPKILEHLAAPGYLGFIKRDGQFEEITEEIALKYPRSVFECWYELEPLNLDDL